MERLPRGEGEAVPVNRIEPRIVPHEPDPDLLADARQKYARRQTNFAERPEFCDHYVPDRGSAETVPSSSRRAPC